MILRTPDDEPNDGIRVTDDREPAHYWYDFQRDKARPLDRNYPYVEGVEHRHVFDVLVAYGREIEQPDDPMRSEEENWRNPPPNHREFRMRLTCLECGHIAGLEGLLTQNDTAKRVDPEPLRAKHLAAQHTSSWGSGRFNSWAVYAGQDLVGAMSTGMGPRGRAFIEGYVVDADGAKHKSEAPTAIGLLRKLASAHSQKPAA